MDLKVVIGQRVKEKRLAKGLSRSQLCRTEMELTECQLMRIELGQSLPSLEKIRYIAKQLEIEVSSLVDEARMVIPEDYYRLKYQLVKFPSYGDAARMLVKQRLLEDIYDRYFSFLPEEELLFLELIEYFLEKRDPISFSSVDCVFKDYFSQVTLKLTYSTNDLFFLSHYFLYHHLSCRLDELCPKIEKRLLKGQTRADDLYNIAFLGALMTLAMTKVSSDHQAGLLAVIEKIKQVLKETQLEYYRVGCLFFEAKYQALRGNFLQMRRFYNKALLLVGIYEDAILEKRLRASRDRDLNILQKKRTDQSVGDIDVYMI